MLLEFLTVCTLIHVGPACVTCESKMGDYIDGYPAMTFSLLPIEKTEPFDEGRDICSAFLQWKWKPPFENNIKAQASRSPCPSWKIFGVFHLGGQNPYYDIIVAYNGYKLYCGVLRNYEFQVYY